MDYSWRTLYILVIASISWSLKEYVSGVRLARADPDVSKKEVNTNI